MAFLQDILGKPAPERQTILEMMGGSGISWTICKPFAPRCRQITMPAPITYFFTDQMLFLTPNQQYQSSALKADLLPLKCRKMTFSGQIFAPDLNVELSASSQTF